jgi:regulator of cell morphogenesis and NO signaling
MTETLTERTVGEIVAADWRTAAVFDQFGIDFCCGGRQSVADACRKAGVDTAAVERAVAALPDTAPEHDVSRWSVDRLAAHIESTHHAYVRTALPRIAGYLAKLVEVHGRRHPELAQAEGAFGAIARELLQHMRKEEQVLFPYIRELATSSGRLAPSPFGTVENPIRMMEREHEAAGALLDELRTLTNGYTVPADGCTTYRVCLSDLAEFERDLHRHVHLENNVLFPRTVALEASRR